MTVFMSLLITASELFDQPNNDSEDDFYTGCRMENHLLANCISKITAISSAR